MGILRTGEAGIVASVRGESSTVRPTKRRRNIPFRRLRASNGGRNAREDWGSVVQKAQLARSSNINFEDSSSISGAGRAGYRAAEHQERSGS